MKRETIRNSPEVGDTVVLNSPTPAFIIGDVSKLGVKQVFYG